MNGIDRHHHGEEKLEHLRDGQVLFPPQPPRLDIHELTIFHKSILLYLRTVKGVNKKILLTRSMVYNGTGYKGNFGPSTEALFSE